MEMDPRNNGNAAGMRRNGQVEQEQEGQRSAKKLKGSIAVEAFSCGVCARLLSPPIFQCSSAPGHFICSSCRDKLPEPDKTKCPFCSAGYALSCSLGMERAARSILVDCRYAERGCTEKTPYYDQHSHDKGCPHAPCLCPEPGCGGFVGSPDELLAHLTGHHGWPSTAFRYLVPFDLDVDEPGAQVLRCEEDGQLFLVHVAQTARPPGRAVSLVGVPPYRKPTGFGCRAVYSCFRSHRGTAALDDIRRVSDWPPATELLCVLPEVSDGGNEPASVPAVTVTFVCASPDGGETSWHDTSYLESDEEDDSDYS